MLPIGYLVQRGQYPQLDPDDIVSVMCSVVRVKPDDPSILYILLTQISRNAQIDGLFSNRIKNVTPSGYPELVQLGKADIDSLATVCVRLKNYTPCPITDISEAGINDKWFNISGEYDHKSLLKTCYNFAKHQIPKLNDRSRVIKKLNLLLNLTGRLIPRWLSHVYGQFEECKTMVESMPTMDLHTGKVLMTLSESEVSTYEDEGDQESGEDQEDQSGEDGEDDESSNKKKRKPRKPRDKVSQKDQMTKLVQAQDKKLRNQATKSTVINDAVVSLIDEVLPREKQDLPDLPIDQQEATPEVLAIHLLKYRHPMPSIYVTDEIVVVESLWQRQANVVKSNTVAAKLLINPAHLVASMAFVYVGHASDLVPVLKEAKQNMDQEGFFVVTRLPTVAERKHFDRPPWMTEKVWQNIWGKFVVQGGQHQVLGRRIAMAADRAKIVAAKPYLEGGLWIIEPV